MRYFTISLYGWKTEGWSSCLSYYHGQEAVESHGPCPKARVRARCPTLWERNASWKEVVAQDGARIGRAPDVELKSRALSQGDGGAMEGS